MEKDGQQTDETNSEGAKDNKDLETDEKPLSEYDKALALVKRREEATKAEREILEEKKKMEANALLAGTAGPRIEPKKPERLTDKEYFEAYEKGEVDPFKEDGYV